MSLFGATQNQGSSLFGSQNKPPALTLQPTQSTSLFGSGTQAAQTQQPQQQSTSLFGSLNQSQNQIQPQQNTSLFGSLNHNQNQQQQPQQNSLFGSLNQSQQQQPPQNSLFGSLNQNQNQQNQQQQQQAGALTLGQSQKPGGASVWNPQAAVSPREKSIPDQMLTILEKWSPDSPNCVFQHYFYNSVPPEHVPYYVPSANEDEKKWEEALNSKPSEGSIPVLGKGFAAVAQRLRIQVEAVTALQSRLHEINNSLTAMMQTHDLDIAVRATEARRRHTVIGQRCLKLAAKVQVLRNQGYALGGAEEALKSKLAQLEKGAFDPVLTGRQEEIWARMSGVRARARFLQDEFEKTGRSLAESDEEIIDGETMKTIKKILGDYDAQLNHLKSEVEQIMKDTVEWQGTLEPVANGTPARRR